MDSDQYAPLPPEYNVDVPLVRKSKDDTINSYGKELLELCISCEVRIINGRVGSDGGKGDFTCHTPRGNSTVDYSGTSEIGTPRGNGFCPL